MSGRRALSLIAAYLVLVGAGAAVTYRHLQMSGAEERAFDEVAKADVYTPRGKPAGLAYLRKCVLQHENEALRTAACYRIMKASHTPELWDLLEEAMPHEPSAALRRTMAQKLILNVRLARPDKAWDYLTHLVFVEDSFLRRVAIEELVRTADGATYVHDVAATLSALYPEDQVFLRTLPFQSG